MIALLLSLAQAPAPVRATFSAEATAALSRVSPTPLDRPGAELRIEQALFHSRVSAWGERLAFHGTLNVEGLTMPNGVLTPGAWGEGFVDRRHPHTYVHELLATVRTGPLSAAAGKGFVAFGSEDPMNRPALRYPANHHWAQILERAVIIAAAGLDRLVVEATLFNGDEPEEPWQWPRLSGRFGDSWAIRLTGRPAEGVEAQLSRARVKSPEHRGGLASPHEKWSASARLDRMVGASRIYALAEWARNTEGYGFFRFHTALLEASVGRGRHTGYFRVERTDRPEEERSSDPFRSLRPHLEDTILGQTRWTIGTAGYRAVFSFPRSGVRLEPRLEATLARIANVGTGVLRADELYGGTRVWSVTVGLRVAAGPSHRMGRYGLLEDLHPHH